MTLAFAATVLSTVDIDRRVRRAGFPVVVAVAALLGWTAIPALIGDRPWSSAVTIAPDAYPLEFLKLSAAAALFFGATAMGLQRGLCRSVGGWIVFFGGLLLIATIAARQVGVLSWMGGAPESGFHRFNGTIGNPNAAGCVYGMISLVAAGYAIDRLNLVEKEARDVLTVGGAILTAGGAIGFLLLSQSRSAFLLTALALATLVGTRVAAWHAYGKIGVRRWSMIFVGMLATGVGVPAIASAMLDRLSLATSDGLDRWASLRHHASLAWHAPTFGYGLGSFFDFNQRSLEAGTALQFWTFGAAHNAALQFALEAGWPALALLISAGVLVAIRTVPALIAHHDPIGMAMILAVCMAIGCSCVDIALNVPGIAAFTVALAGLCWGRSLRFRSTSQSDDGRASFS